jgi:hypothetical protein
MSKLPNVPSLDIPPLVISPSTSPSSPLARRIVTGRDEDAKSRILYDDDKGNVEWVA